MERCDILRDARVVPQRGDNTWLFHSLSFCLSYDGIEPSIHDDMSGFRLREQICSYIRDNEDMVISFSPDEQRVAPSGSATPFSRLDAVSTLVSSCSQPRLLVTS